MGYFYAPDEVFELPVSANAKLILLNLCRRADKKGCSFPSRRKIASDCSMTVRTVDSGIKELEDKKTIMKSKKTGKSNTYHLCNEYINLIKTTTFKDQPEQNLHRGGASPAPVPLHLLHPKENQVKDNNLKEVKSCNKNNFNTTKKIDCDSLNEQVIENYMQEWRNMEIDDKKIVDDEARQLIPFGSGINITGGEDEISNRFRARVFLRRKKANRGGMHYKHSIN